MKLVTKLLVVVSLPAVLIWQVGYYAMNVSKRTLRVAIERQSDSQAESLMDEIDRVVLTHLANWQAYANGQVVQKTLKASNSSFGQLAVTSFTSRLYISSARSGCAMAASSVSSASKSDSKIGCGG